MFLKAFMIKVELALVYGTSLANDFQQEKIQGRNERCFLGYLAYICMWH